MTQSRQQRRNLNTLMVLVGVVAFMDFARAPSAAKARMFGISALGSSR